MNLQNVRLENAVLKAKKGITAVDSDGIELKNVHVIAQTGPALTIYNSKNIDVTGLTYQQSQEPVVQVLGPLTRNVKLENKDFKDVARQISKGKDLVTAALTLK